MLPLAGEFLFPVFFLKTRIICRYRRNQVFSHLLFPFALNFANGIRSIPRHVRQHTFHPLLLLPLRSEAVEGQTALPTLWYALCRRRHAGMWLWGVAVRYQSAEKPGRDHTAARNPKTRVHGALRRRLQLPDQNVPHQHA